MRQRIWLIYLVPFIPLMIWQVVILTGIGSSARDPQWAVSGDGQTFGSCAAAVSIDGFDVDTDVNLEDATIVPLEAYDTARKVVGHSPDFRLIGLVNVRLPDGERKLVWAQVLVLDDGGATLMGPTEVVYVDAQSGVPLVRVTDVFVGDPFLAGCELLLASAIDDFFADWQPLVYMVVYGLALIGAVGLVSLLKRIRSRRARQSSSE